jgi:hypothetical protein
VGEEPGAEVEQESLADPIRQVVVEEPDHPGEQRQSHVRAGDPDERAEVLRDQHLIDDDLEHPDHRRVDQRDQRDQQQAERQPAAVGARVRPEAPEDLAHRHFGRGADQRLALGRHREQRTESSSQSSPPALPELDSLTLASDVSALVSAPVPVPGVAGVESEILP